MTVNKILLLALSLHILSGISLAGVSTGPTVESVIPDTFGGVLADDAAERIVGIKVEGNKRTEDWLILKEFGVKAGDYFHVRKVREGLQNLKNLGYFYRVSYGIRRNQQGIVIILVVEDRLTLYPTIHLGSGGGYDTVKLGAADRNFLGKGMNLEGEYEFASTQRSFNISHSQRYLWGTDNYVKVNFSNLVMKDRVYFDQGLLDRYKVRFTARGGAILIGRRTSRKEFWGIKPVIYHHSYSRQKIDDDNDDFQDENLLPKLKNGRTVMLKTVFNWRGVDVDNYLYNGYYGSVELGISDKVTGSEFSFGQVEVVQKYFWGRGIHNLCGSLRLLGNSSRQLQHKFTIGGPDGVRGFLYRQFRGNRAGVLNLEYRFSIYDTKEIFMQSVLFNDLARVWDYGGSNGLNEDAIVSVGIGFRFVIKRIYRGIGRLDLARTIEPYEGWGIVLGLGQYF
ncbi:MAG: BamA/TamA family outer membrane protein [bacterium]